jgi:hypothetical protein
MAIGPVSRIFCLVDHGRINLGERKKAIKSFELPWNCEVKDVKKLQKFANKIVQMYRSLKVTSDHVLLKFS